MTDKPTKPGFYWARWGATKYGWSGEPQTVGVVLRSGQEPYVIVVASTSSYSLDDFTFLPPVEPLKYQPPKGERG